MAPAAGERGPGAAPDPILRGSVNSASALDIPLIPASIQVLDSKTQQPIAGQRIQAVAPLLLSRAAIAETGSQGRATFSLCAGEYAITAHSADNGLDRPTIQWTANGPNPACIAVPVKAQ